MCNKVVDLPKQIKKKIYYNYIEKYVDTVKKIEGVISIYQMGGITNPGISDIDLIVVVEDHFKVSEYNKLSVRKVFTNDTIANYLFIHDVVILDINSFINVEYIGYFSGLKLLYGENIKINKLNNIERKVVQFSIISDFIISRLHQFERFKMNKVFMVRGNIVRGSSVKHSLNLAENLGIKIDYSLLTEEIKNVRENWFYKQDIDEVKKLFHTCKTYFYRLILEISNFYNNEFLLFKADNYKNHLMLLNDMKNITIFTEEDVVINCYNELNNNQYNDVIKIIKSKIQNDFTIVLYSRDLYFHYLSYAKTENNMISQKIKNKLLNTDILFDTTDDYKNTIQKRCKAISDLSKFLLDNRIYFSNCPAYPGFYPL